MALNFGILQPVNIGGQFMAGQKQAQENQLAQQQASIREQEMGMRQQEMGMRQREAVEKTEDRATKLKKAETRTKFLTDLSAKMNEGGHKLDRQTLSSMMNFGLQNNETSLVDLATKGLLALDEDERFKTEMGSFAAKAPGVSTMPAATAAPGALGSGTFDPNAPAPVAPVNALAPAAAAPAAPTAATPVNAMVGGYTRPQIEQMLLSPTDKVRKTGVALLAALPKVSEPTAPPASIAEYRLSSTDPKFMEFLQKRSAANRAPGVDRAPRTQQVTLSDGSIGIINMDTGAITSATLGGAGVKGKDSTKTAVSEQQAAYNIGRVLTAANEIKNITSTDPSSVQPGAAEALAASVGMSGTANLARSANRQIVQGAQRDALDALLYLATGAAYNKEQLQGQMEAYVPAYTDKPAQLAAKKTRMTELIKNAKTRAGSAWTPQMDTALKSLMAPATGTAAPAAGGATGEWGKAEVESK